MSNGILGFLESLEQTGKNLSNQISTTVENFTGRELAINQSGTANNTNIDKVVTIPAESNKVPSSDVANILKFDLTKLTPMQIGLILGGSGLLVYVLYKVSRMK